MSKSLDIAEAMAASLNAEPTLYTAGVETLVDRQKNLSATIAANVAKNTGGCIIVAFEGFANPDRRPTATPVILRQYSVRIFARPILQTEAEMPADDLCELAARALQNSQPEGAATLIRVRGGDLIQDPKFLIYDLSVEVESRL